MGLTEVADLTRPGCHLRLWRHGADDPMQWCQFENGDFAACLGTLIYGGAAGAEALRRLMANWRGGPALPEGSAGHFILILARGGLLWLLTDLACAATLYVTGDGTTWSSSFLLLADRLARATLNRWAVYEYVLTGAVTGDQTLVDEITRLPFGASVMVDARTTRLLRTATGLPATAGRSRTDLLDEAQDRLTLLVKNIIGAFGGRVRCALTGGYDSRLIYALLRHHGLVPDLFTYRENDAEMALVTRLAAAEGVALEVIADETLSFPEADQFAAEADDNFHLSDGCFSVGIFNAHREHERRRHRSRHGCVFLHGGGGEVLRNFFMLPARPCTATEVARAGFAKFDAGICAGPFGLEAYIDHLAGKIAALAGSRRFNRAVAEWLYATFRCRAWFGRENSLNCQHGESLVPFLFPEITQFAATIPVSYKASGTFEAELIARLWPPVAGLASQYGHGFHRPPPLWRRIKEHAKMLVRPAWRPPLYALRQKYSVFPSAPLLGQDYVAAVLPDGVVWMRPLFHRHRMTSPLQISRLLTAEYLAQWLGGRAHADWLA
jgi:asparagine synthase (glutamine-hydrolysing)